MTTFLACMAFCVLYCSLMNWLNGKTWRGQPRPPKRRRTTTSHVVIGEPSMVELARKWRERREERES